MAWTPPRRITSATTSVSVISTTDTSVFITHPNTYRGNDTFNTLTAVKNSINATTGGFAPLNDGTAGTTLYGGLSNRSIGIVGKTTLRPALLSGADASTIGWRGTFGGSTTVYANPSAIFCIWGGGMFNGHAFFCGVNGGHQAWYGNDLYMVRVADPVGAYRVHDPAPPGAATGAGFTGPSSGFAYPAGVSTLLARVDWYTSSAYAAAIRPIGEWGPMTQHNYSGWGWDPINEQIVFTGDAQINIRNMSAELQPAISDGVIWTFDINAATPKQAWGTPHVFHPNEIGTGYTEGFKAGYSVVRNADNTFGFRSSGDSLTVRTLNPATGAITTGRAVGAGGPVPSRYGPWPDTVRDPITNKYYEVGGPDVYDTVVGGYRTNFRLWECVNGGYQSRFHWLGTPMNPGLLVNDAVWNKVRTDASPGMVVRNGIAYCWVGTNQVLRVDTNAGTYTKYIGTENVQHDLDGGVFNGVYGRWAYHEATGVFVGLSTTEQDVWVFRPPSSWGAI